MFGHYRVEREIAAGGMGMVYEAEDMRLGRRVALKMLRQVFFATELDRLRFQTEAEMVSQLDHPHIVPVHEVGVHEGQPYFTMKFIRGGHLGERIAAGAIPAREAAGLMVKIAGAVHHAHQRSVLHRDLKPANILLDEAGEPWLTDFGVAKWLEKHSALTLTRSIIGTPDYMSPEQASGRTSAISTASDIWSLGVILYEMLTGRRPFHGESAPGIIRDAAEHDPARPSTITRGLDRDLETLCLRCLEKDPAQRPSSAGELAEELQRWLRGEPIRARRITGMERVGKWARRHPWRTAFLAAFLIIFLGSGAAVTWQWRRAAANEQRALASAEAERRTSYSALLAQAFAAREHHDFGQARRLLSNIAPELRGFDWRLLHSLCRGDDLQSWRFNAGPECLTLTPDQQHLAVITAGGRLHRYDLEGREVDAPRTLPPLPPDAGDARNYRGLTYSPNGARLAYTCGDVIQVLDAESLTVLYEEVSRLPQCGWLDDDRLLYGFNGSIITPPWPEPGAWILNFRGVTAAGTDIPRTGFPQMCAPLAVSPDRRSFVLQLVEATPSSWARTLHVYQADGDYTKIPAPLYSMPGLEYPGVLAFSRSGKFLAFSAGPNLRRAARVLEVATGMAVFDSVMRFPIHALAFDPQERQLGIVGGDSVVRLYDITRGSPEGSNQNSYDDDVDPARCQPVDGRGAHAPPANLTTRSAQDGRARFYLGHEKQVSDLVFDPAGSLITASEDRTLRQWPVAAAHRAVRIGHMDTTYPLYHPAASADGLRVLYLEGDVARLCNVPLSRAGIYHVTLPTGPAQAPLAVLSDGRVVTHDRITGQVLIWMPDGGQLREQQRLSGAVPAPNTGMGRTRRGVLSRDEKRLAGAYEGWLFTVDLVKGTLTWSGDLGLKARSYFGLGFTRYANHDLSPDGEWIATSDFGPRVTIHRFAEPGNIVATLGGDPRDNDTVVVFSRDGHRLFTGNEDGRVRVWDTANWQEIPALAWPAHRTAVTAIAVSCDGTLVATSGDDTLKIFSAQPGPGEFARRERLAFHLDEPANWIHFARGENCQDRALLYSSPRGTLEILETDDAGKPEAPPAPTGDLPFPFRNHQAILLPDGKVLVAGIRSTAMVPLSDCLLYDPDEAVWMPAAPLRRPRWDPALTLLQDGKVLVAGGRGHGADLLKSCELYDPASETWSATGAMTTPHDGGAFIALTDGKVLAAGGFAATDIAAGCELYDPATGTWSPTGALLTPRYAASWALLADGKVLAAGGVDAKGATLGSCELYDPKSGAWTSTGSLNVPRSGAAAIALPGGGVLICGGSIGAAVPPPACDRYDPLTGIWKPAAPWPARRLYPSVTLLPNGKVIVAGGQMDPNFVSGDSGFRGSPVNTALFYDPATDTWSPAPDLPSHRASHTATLLKNGRVLLVGGSDEHFCALQKVDVYDPGPQAVKTR